MALATHIIYQDADGELVASFLFDAGWTPSAEQMDGWPDNCSHLEAPLQEPVPRKETHCVDLGGPTLAGKDQPTQDAEAKVLRKSQIEQLVAELDIKKAALSARSFDTGSIDSQITALMAEHATLP